MKEAVKKITSSLCLAIFTVTLPACTRLADDLIVIEDIEATSYGEWMVEGDAFGKGPIEEDNGLGPAQASLTNRLPAVAGRG